MPHIHDKIDFTVEVFVVHDNVVLLRWHDKYNFWCSVGGHIELDEDPVQAAIREVKEEVGLDIQIIPQHEIAQPADENYKELIPPRYLNRHRISSTHEHVTMVYFATSNSREIITDQTHDRSDRCVWADAEKLKTLDLKENIRFYCEQTLKELKSRDV